MDPDALRSDITVINARCCEDVRTGPCAPTVTSASLPTEINCYTTCSNGFEEAWLETIQACSGNRRQSYKPCTDRKPSSSVRPMLARIRPLSPQVLDQIFAVACCLRPTALMTSCSPSAFSKDHNNRTPPA